MKALYAVPVVLSLAGCVSVPTGPLSDPQVLAARCAELNLALTVAQISSKVPADKINAAQAAISTFCNSGGIVDYPTALNALSAALVQLRTK